MATEPHERVTAALAATEAPRRGVRRAATPTPWAPGYALDGDEGELTTDAVPADDHVDWDSIFRAWNLDPDAWAVVDGTLRVNAWEGPSQDGPRVFRQYKAAIRRRPDQSRPTVVDPVLERIARHRPRRPAARTTTPGSFVTAWADWQVGGHDDPAAFADRFAASLDAITARARVAARAGIRHLVVAFLGDMVEGTDGNYAAQAFTVTLDGRAQRRLTRAAEAKVLTTLAPLFDSTTAVAVPGNHGRGGPKVTTTTADNADLECFEVVAEHLTAGGFAAEHDLRFVENPAAQIALVDASGTQLLVVHGDQVPGSADRLRQWWRDVSFTRWADADLGHVLLAGHRHHLRVEELATDRWLVQCPTLGGESAWFAELGGGTSHPGTVSFVTAGGRWWDLHID